MSADPAAQIGYQLVLPPGWIRIPLREDPEPIIDTILARSFSNLPADRYGPIRAELTKRILAQVAVARDNEGLDLYVPVERMHGQIIAASFLVGLMPFHSVEVPDAADVLAHYAAQSEGAELVELGGAAAVRTERVVAAEPAADPNAEESFGSRRVDYVTAIPNARDTFLSISFSTVGDGSPDGEVAQVLVDLFDAIMSTFRWTMRT
jgi:hypothetical protein